jgi:cystathionine beta-lyase/cystathionine gamma-synthase
MNQLNQLDYDHLVFSKTKKGYHYNRSHSNEVDYLANLLKNRYNTNVQDNKVDSCFILPSGLCAISTILNCVVKKMNIQHIIYGSELYSDTPELIWLIASTYNVGHTTFDVTCTESLFDDKHNKYKDEPIILFFESCTNPNGFIFDFDVIPKLRQHFTKLIIIVDNTWLTSAILNPFFYDIDIVITSLTKYYSGGTALGGALLVSSKLNIIVDNIMTWISLNGLHTSPHNAEIITENLYSLDDRIKKSSDLTINVLDHLKSNNKIVNISHPYLSDVTIDNKYIKLWPSVFTFAIKASKNKVLKILQKSNIIEHKTSFGSKHTRSDPWPYKQGDLTIIRISIGYDDDYDKIIKGLDQIIDNL